MLSIYEIIRHTIIKQLNLGACCRIHLHRECCLALGVGTKPLINEKNQRIRICKDMSDNKFDKPFTDLIDEKIIQKIPTESVYAFYELTEKGKKIVTESQ